MKEIAQRAIACKGWRWMPGMKAAHRWAEGIRVVTCDGASPDPYIVINDDEGVILATVDEYGIMGSFPEAGSAYPFLPDLTDPATLGCVMSLVWKAYANAVVITQGNDWWSVETDNHRWDQDNTTSFQEALIAALEAAP
jgi:hypothetical protein